MESKFDKLVEKLGVPDVHNKQEWIDAMAEDMIHAVSRQVCSTIAQSGEAAQMLMMRDLASGETNPFHEIQHDAMVEVAFHFAETFPALAILVKQLEQKESVTGALALVAERRIKHTDKQDTEYTY